MTTLTEFLLARIAEDEWVATEASLLANAWETSSREHARRMSRDSEVKRRIIGMLVISAEQHELTLHLLALPYADHPGYRQEWRL